MSNDSQDDVNIENNDDDQVPETNKPNISADVNEQVEKLVEERLAKMKGNLDKAYKEITDLKAANQKLLQEKSDAEKDRLRKEGKELEVLALELQEALAQLDAERGQNTQLNRDMMLRNALTSKDLFRNDSAREMAFREICANLTQDENGVWVHKSGVTISQAVESFVANPDNSFMLKAKNNSGSGSGKPTTSPQTKPTGSIFDMSQEEVLRLAGEGKLRK